MKNASRRLSPIVVSTAMPPVYLWGVYGQWPGAPHRPRSGRLVGMENQPQPHVVIVGGGIAGLAAAFFLRDEPVRVTVLEGSPRLGGKLSVSQIAGVAVDEGAEAMLVTRPEGIELITAAGLGDDLVPAGVTSSAIYTRGALRS